MKNYKKIFVIAFVIVLITTYTWAFFRPGIRYRKAFLYEKDGVFSGADKYAEYTVKIDRTENGAKIAFSLNDETYDYEVKKLADPYVEIYENGMKIFDGKVLDLGETYMLHDNNGNLMDVYISYEGEIPQKADLLPSCTKLYSLAEGDVEKRGNTLPAVVIIFAAIFLFLDIKFPMLFFYTRHRFDVDGGEPSDWYRFKQYVSRIILAVTIAVCVVLTFVNV